MINGLVFTAMGAAVFFGLFWWRFPALRQWIERPKHQFQSNVQSYDQIALKKDTVQHD